MLKLFGAILVMLGSLGAGMLRRAELEEKPRRLRKMYWEIEEIGAKIRSCGLSLEDCFAESDSFRRAAEEIKNGVPAEKAVLDCGEQTSGLVLFARGLCAETVDGQLRNIEVFLKSLEGDAATAERELEKKGRLWPGLGALIGAAICIVLV